MKRSQFDWQDASVRREQTLRDLRHSRWAEDSPSPTRQLGAIMIGAAILCGLFGLLWLGN